MRAHSQSALEGSHENPVKLKTTERKNPPDNEKWLVLHLILVTF